MIIKKCLYIVALISALQCKMTYAESNEMIFKNEKGSILKYQKLADNKIQGSFTSAVSSKQCIIARSKTYPITGIILGNAISFSVSYPESQTGETIEVPVRYKEDLWRINPVALAGILHPSLKVIA